jgi:putative addiction module component (TIGR02574 family)
MTHNNLDLDSLSCAERLLLVQALWDSLVEVAEPIPLNEAELRWLEDRIAYADRLDAEWFSFDQLVADFAGRR